MPCNWTPVGHYVIVLSKKKDSGQTEFECKDNDIIARSLYIVLENIDIDTNIEKFLSQLKSSSLDEAHENNMHDIFKEALVKCSNYLKKNHVDSNSKSRSDRIREGINKARERGAMLGNPNPDPDNARQVYIENASRFRVNIAPLINELSQNGLSLNAIARELNNRQIPTKRGKRWHASSIRNILSECALER